MASTTGKVHYLLIQSDKKSHFSNAHQPEINY